MGIQADFFDEEVSDSDISLGDDDDLKVSNDDFTEQQGQLAPPTKVETTDPVEVMPRKKVELKYFFGRDLSKNELEKHACFQCRNCGKTYTNAAYLIGHLKFKSSTGQQRSIFLPQPSDPAEQVKVKLFDKVLARENEKMKKFRCPTCDKGFIRNYTLQCHMLIHTGRKDHKCETCSKEFTLAQHLQRHVMTHTGEKPYNCHLCGKAFSQQGSLQAHSRTHTCVKPYKCEVCGRAFALQSPLLSHQKTHHNEKPFKCSKCDRSFKHRNTLARHKLIHSGTRRYSCTKCGKTFTQTNDLKRRSRIHAGIRPYKCHICGRAFTVEFTLVCHIRTHTGIRPYSRKYCDKTFTQSGAGLKHIRRLHPGKPIPESSTRDSTKKVSGEGTSENVGGAPEQTNGPIHQQQ